MEFKEFFDDSPIAFYTCNRDGIITYYNSAAAQIWGRSPEIGKEYWCGSWKAFDREGKAVRFEDYPIFCSIKTAAPVENQEIKVLRKDGSSRNILAFSKPLTDNEGKLIGGYTTLVDITEQVKSDLKTATLSAIVESSGDAIISKDLSGRILTWNRGAERIFGYSEEEVVGKEITIIIPESRLGEEEYILSNIKNGKRVDHFETVRISKSGKEIPISVTISPLKDRNGKIIGASKVGRDISDRLEVEEKRAILSAIVESSDDAIISKDLEGNIMSWNSGAEKIFGYSEKEVIGKSIFILVPEDRLEEEEAILNKIRRGERIAHYETSRRHRSGKSVQTSITISPIRNNLGKIIGVSKVARDISARVESEKRIKKYTRNLEILNSLGKSISKNLELEAILEQVTTATTILTGAAFGAFYYKGNSDSGKKRNDRFKVVSLSGISRNEFEKSVGQYEKLFLPLFATKRVKRINNKVSLKEWGIQEDLLSEESYMIVPIVSNSGMVRGGLLLGHLEKDAFQKEQEELVLNIASQAAISMENSRLFNRVRTLNAKKDEFIALASHELKTPMTTIKGYLQVLMQNEKDQLSSLFLKRSHYQVEKLNSLVEDLLNMSRIEANKLEFRKDKFDIRQLLLEIIETFDYTNKTHELIHHLGGGPAFVVGDRQRIEQVVFNLLTNAIKYSPEADVVYLKLETSNEKVTIRIKDEGIGLTTSQTQKLFTRYYRAETTSGISGLGLGLYLAKQIIDRHNGKINVSSEFGKGSEFYFSLPLASQEKLLRPETSNH